MKIRLLRKKTPEEEKAGSGPTAVATTDARDAPAPAGRVSHRRFLKGLAGALGLFGVAQISTPKSAAAATGVGATAHQLRSSQAFTGTLSADTVNTDVINERTLDHGVIVDGLLIKDGAIVGYGLTVQEVDGAPSVANVKTIQFTNGTVTAVDPANGIVSVTSGGGSVPSDPTFNTVTIGTNPAQSGVLRLPNGSWIVARNGANTADVNVLKVAPTNSVFLRDHHIYVSGQNQNTINSYHDSNTDNNDLWVNYRGYNDGNTRSRNFVVGNGKQGQLARFSGHDGRIYHGVPHYVQYAAPAIAKDVQMELAHEQNSYDPSIVLRFHQHGRWWHRIEAQSGGFYFRTGDTSTDSLVTTHAHVVNSGGLACQRHSYGGLRHQEYGQYLFSSIPGNSVYSVWTTLIDPFASNANTVHSGRYCEAGADSGKFVATGFGETTRVYTRVWNANSTTGTNCSINWYAEGPD